MFFDYDFRNYNFRLMTYMIALNVIGVLVVRSATNKDPDFVTKQMLGVLVGLAIAEAGSRKDRRRNCKSIYLPGTLF